MKFVADLFPYPVLNSELDDYIQSSFKIEYLAKQETQSMLVMNIVYNLDDPKLLELIKKGKAVYAVHLEGVASSFRELHTTKHKYQEVVINVDNLSQKVEVNFFIMATEDIESYRSPNFNPIYYPKDFVVNKLTKSDILAYESVDDLEIKFENRSMSSPQSMIWVTSVKQQRYMSVDIDGDVIEVRLPEKAYQAYYSLSQSNKVHEELLLSTIVLPGLTYAIEQIKRGGIYEDLKWFESLTVMLNDLNYDIGNLEVNDSLKLAQQLLDYPIESSLINYYEWEENIKDE